MLCCTHFSDQQNASYLLNDSNIYLLGVMFFIFVICQKNKLKYGIESLFPRSSAQMIQESHKEDCKVLKPKNLASC